MNSSLAVKVGQATPDILNLTKHALVRMNARGISPADVDVTMAYGRIIHARGAEIYVLGKKEKCALEKLGVSAERLEGTHVVCEPNSGRVITVYKNKAPKRLRQ